MWSWLKLRSREASDREAAREIQAHLELEAEERRDGGMTAGEARLAARRDFGNVAATVEECGDAWLSTAFERLRQDVTYAWRTMRKNPAYTVVAVLTLAFGIGANSAIFSIVNTVLLKPLEYREPSRIVTLLDQGQHPIAPANFLDWQRESRSFEGMEAAGGWSATLTGDEHAEQIPALQVTGGMFELLGVRPLLGRTLMPEDARPGREKVVVLSHRLWQRRFGGDPGIVGRKLELSGEPYTVAGVMPPDFQFAPFWVTDAQMWAPLPLTNREQDRTGQFLRVFARLRPGVSLAAAQAEIDTLSSRLLASYPESNTGMNVRVEPLEEKVVGKIKPVLFVLMGAVGFVLLIACANVANLALARAAGRSNEVAIRRAMGAGWGRLCRQFLTESLLISAVGGALGLLLATWAVSSLKLLVEQGARQAGALLPRADRIALDWHVVLFTAGLAVLTGVVFGLAPALQASRSSTAESLKDGGRSGSGGRRSSRLRSALVIAEVAVSIVLLAGAGLLLRSFFELRRIDPGFQPDNVLTMTVSVAGQAQTVGERRAAFYRQVIDDVRNLPGVRSAALVNHLPIGGDTWGFRVHAEGRPLPKPGEELGAVYRVASPGYFATMGIRLREGRDFAGTDNERTGRVVIVNDKLARSLWADQSPIGKRITTDDPRRGAVEWMTVVGVSANVKQGSWTSDAGNEFYVPLFQDREALSDPQPWRAYITLVARTTGDPLASAAAVQRTVWALNSEAPISEVRSLEQVIAVSLWQARLQMLVLSLFAAFAMGLAVIGVYGVIAYSVAQRAQEIGIRMALGATPGAVVWFVLRHAATLVLCGAAAGLLTALGVTRWLGALLYGVTPTDPLTLAVIPLLLGAVAILASYVPARRAAAIDPASGLRCG